MKPQPIHVRLEKIIAELLDAGIPLDQAREQFEQKYITAALARRRNVKTRAALLLGVHRNTLHNKLRKIDFLVKRYGR